MNVPRLSSLCLMVLAVAFVGCSDDPPSSRERSRTESNTNAGQDVRPRKGRDWLEVGDRTRPEEWLAARSGGNPEEQAQREARFLVLIGIASQTYLENPRMVANRIVQLGAMLEEAGTPENYEDLIEGFLSIPRATSAGGERILSDLAAHYANLRRSGRDREASLAELRAGMPPVDVASLVKREIAARKTSPHVSERPSTDSSMSEADAPAMLERQSVDPKHVTSVMTPDEVSEYVKIAAELHNSISSNGVPRIERVAAEEISRVLCRGQRCGAVAFFDDRTRTVYVDDRLELDKNLSARSYVIHEIVHFFHLVDGRLRQDMPCDERLVLEQEAYEVQNAYLAREGSFQRIGTRLLSSMCRGARGQ
jgi:hypothetical protein